VKETHIIYMKNTFIFNQFTPKDAFRLDYGRHMAGRSLIVLLSESAEADSTFVVERHQQGLRVLMRTP
jgi:hypothetical protein